MSTSKKLISAAAAVLVAATTFAGTSAQAAIKSVSLVYQGPLTGANAQTGQDQVLGVQAALELYNESNPSVKVTLIKADDQGDPSVAGTVAPGIASNKNVVGIVGPAFSGASIASFPSYRSAGIPIVSPSATRTTLTDPKSPDNGFPVFHRVLATDALQGPALVRWGTEGVATPKIYIIDDQSAYSTGLRDLAKAYIKANAAKYSVVGSDSIPQNTADYSATTSKIKASGANVVIYTGYYADAGALAKSLHDGGYKGIFAGGDGVLNNAFIAAAGKDAAEGARFTAGALPFELAATAAQKAALTKATGVTSAQGHAYVTEAFNATNVFLSLISQGKVTRGSIQNGITAGTFATVGGGTISFTRWGEVKGGAPISGFVASAGQIVYKGAK